MTTIITYDQMKEFYNEFKQNPPEDDFRRYTQEYKYLKNLLALAKDEKHEQDITEYQEEYDNLIKQLTDLGYKIVD